MKTSRMLVTMCVVLVAVLFSKVSMAEVQSGTCGAQGDNLTWTLDDGKRLTVGVLYRAPNQ